MTSLPDLLLSAEGQPGLSEPRSLLSPPPTAAGLLGQEPSSWQRPPAWHSEAPPPPWPRPRGHSYGPHPEARDQPQMRRAQEPGTRWVPGTRGPAGEGPAEVTRRGSQAWPAAPLPARAGPRVAWEPGASRLSHPVPCQLGACPAAPGSRPSHLRCRGLPAPARRGPRSRRQARGPGSGWSPELVQLRPDAKQLGWGRGR